MISLWSLVVVSDNSLSNGGRRRADTCSDECFLLPGRNAPDYDLQNRAVVALLLPVPHSSHLRGSAGSAAEGEPLSDDGELGTAGAGAACVTLSRNVAEGMKNSVPVIARLKSRRRS